MNGKDDSNDFMKVISAFRDIEAMLHGEEETIELPVCDLIDLLPEDYVSMDDPSAVPEGKATLKIDNLFFQLSKGKVEVPISALAIALPAQFIRPQALEDEHTMIRLPLQTVVKAIDVDTLKGKMAAKTTRHQAMNIPDPFGPKSEAKPDSPPSVPVPPEEESTPTPAIAPPPSERPVEEAIDAPESAEPEREPVAATEPPAEPPSETPVAREPESPPAPPSEDLPRDEVDAVFEEATDAVSPLAPEPTSLPEPSPEPAEEPVVESEPSASDREPEAVAEPPSESKSEAPPATVFDSIRTFSAAPQSPAEAPAPSTPPATETLAEVPEPEPWASDEQDDFGGVNLNTASAEQLMTLDGVTELVAESILNYREEKGGFKSIFELGKIPRVGRKTFRKMTGMPYSLSHRHRRLKLAGLLNVPPASIGRLPTIAQRLASRPGFSGCVVSNAEGLTLAEHGATECAEKLGAVMPRLVQQAGENVRLLEMGATESVSICLKNRMFTVAMSGNICLTVVHKRNTLTRNQLALVRKVAEELAWLLSYRAYVRRG